MKLKYRRLTDEELEILKNEFVQYLVANGIDSDMWEKFKKEDPDKASIFVDLFSDVVLEKSLEKVEYLEHRTPSDLKLFYCGQDKMDLIALKSTSVDLTNLKDFTEEDFANVELFTASKNYDKKRELEIFELTQKGCEVTNHILYRLLEQFVKKD